MRALLVEDDPEISAALRVGLEAAGFHVEVVRDGLRALRQAQADRYAIVVLDRMLPSLDGLGVCRALRAEGVRTPILMLTAMGELQDRIDGLDGGADDYLAKPFEFGELLARIRALVRRDKVARSAVVEIADLRIDAAARTASRAGRELPLTQREYTLLEALALRTGQVVGRETILRSIWVDEFSTSNTVDVHVRNLRKKVDEGHEVKLIHTVFGAGYVLKVAPEEEPA